MGVLSAKVGGVWVPIVDSSVVPTDEVWVGTTDPRPTLAPDAELWFDTLVPPGQLKAWDGTAWVLAVDAGTIILDGDGPPDDALGEVGDYYLDTTSGILYGPKGVPAPPVYEYAMVDAPNGDQFGMGTGAGGAQFKFKVAAEVVGLRFYKQSGEPQSTTRVITLYDAVNNVLATATPANEPPTGTPGYVVAMLATPVPVNVDDVVGVGMTWPGARPNGVPHPTTGVEVDPNDIEWLGGTWGDPPVGPTASADHLLDLLYQLPGAVAGPPAWPISIYIPEALPPGGTTGQVLSKATDADFDATWQDAAAGSVEEVFIGAGDPGGPGDPDVLEPGNTYELWFDPGPPITALGATAGTPGFYTPTGSVAPANLAGMAGLIATPGVHWAIGEHVITADTLHTYWDGAAWQLGDAPTPPPPTNPTGVVSGQPGQFTPASALIPANLVALQSLGALGQTTEWAPNHWVELADSKLARWNSTAWEDAPAGYLWEFLDPSSPAAGTPPERPAKIGSVNSDPRWSPSSWGIAGTPAWDPWNFIEIGAPEGKPYDYVTWSGTGWMQANTKYTLAELQASAWTPVSGIWTDEYFPLLDGTFAKWDGSAWVARAEPDWPGAPEIPPTGATAGIPGFFTPAGCRLPRDADSMTGSIVANPMTLWTTGQYVACYNSNAHWNGTYWATGTAP